MKKIRNFVAVTLFALPLMTTNASSLTNASSDTSIKPTHASVCYYYFAGMWFPYAC